MHSDSPETATSSQAYHRSLWLSKKFGRKSWA